MSSSGGSFLGGIGKGDGGSDDGGKGGSNSGRSRSHNGYGGMRRRKQKRRRGRGEGSPPTPNELNIIMTTDHCDIETRRRLSLFRLGFGEIGIVHGQLLHYDVIYFFSSNIVFYTTVLSL